MPKFNKITRNLPKTHRLDAACVGPVAVRATGSLNVKTDTATVHRIGWRYFRLLHASDGYAYNFIIQARRAEALFPPTPKGLGFHS